MSDYPTAVTVLASLLFVVVPTLGCGDGSVISGETCCFETVATGSEHGCALDDGGTIHCWGANDDGQSEPPDGSFRDLQLTGSNSCALNEQDEVHCWGSLPLTDPRPEGNFEVFGDAWCKRDDTGQVDDCLWRSLQHDEVPEDIDIAEVSYQCLLDTDGRPHCWGDEMRGQTSVPGGQFITISTGPEYGCGLHDDHRLECWGGSPEFQRVPDGRFDQLELTATYGCLRDADTGELNCWDHPGSDREAEAGQAQPPSGSYAEFSTASNHACAIDDDGYLTCWGDDDQGRLDVP